MRRTSTLLTAAAAVATTTIDAFTPSSLYSARTIQQKSVGGIPTAARSKKNHHGGIVSTQLQMSSLPPGIENQPTELPDSLSDAASIAANVSFL